jgi:hypothetical protein
MNYDAQYFIDKFSDIPEESWCTGVYIDNLGRRCALGHCAYFGDEDANGIRKLFSSKIGSINAWGGLVHRIGDINDGDHPDFTQDTPKQRILAALQLIKKSEVASAPQE